MPQTARGSRPSEYSPLVASALLVDSDPDTRLLYRTVFEPFVGAFVEAEDGAEALGKAIQDHPDLIVTEVRLRRVDGFALCSLLRRDPVTHDVRIMVITSAASPVDRERAATAGANEVLVKPCDLGDMIAALRRMCERPHNGDGPAPSAIERRSDTPQPHNGIKSRSYARRFTTTPPNLPPCIFCPSCAAQLVYVNSHVGGVSASHPEQWDYFTCATCGTFRYRHRTRKLTSSEDLPDASRVAQP